MRWPGGPDWSVRSRWHAHLALADVSRVRRVGWLCIPALTIPARTSCAGTSWAGRLRDQLGCGQGEIEIVLDRRDLRDVAAALGQRKETELVAEAPAGLGRDHDRA